MSGITTHILDTSTGRPASGIDVVLEVQRGPAEWATVGRGATDADGRLRTLVPFGTPPEAQVRARSAQASRAAAEYPTGSASLVPMMRA